MDHVTMKRRHMAQKENGKDDEEKGTLLKTANVEKRKRTPYHFLVKGQVSVWRLRGAAVLLVLLLALAASGVVRRVGTIKQRRAERRRNRGTEERTQEPKKEASQNTLPTSSSLFPREPKLTPGCSVKFQHTNMSLCYFLPYGANFGDELGPAAVKRILEYHYGCSSADVDVIDMSGPPGKRNNRTCLFALGSIFHYTRDGDHIWGTGINPHHQGPHPKWLHVHSVRGNETERKMKEWYKYHSVPHGDPGFLIPSLYQDYYHLPTKSIGKEPAYTQPKFCFIPHAQDLTLDEMKNPPPDLQIISVKQHWVPMIEAICMCDYVVSTSLHGVVVADALGIPSKWFQFNASLTQMTEGSFKYHDYLWSIGRNVTEPERTFNMAVFKRTSTYMGPIPLETRKKLVRQFASSFPFHIFRKSLVPLQSTEVQPDCDVSFKDEKMALCVLSKDTGFVGDMGVVVVKRLLENRFGCSADNLPIISVQEREGGRDRTHNCFLTQGGTIGYALDGDHVWGAGATSRKLGKVPSSVFVSSVRGPVTEAAVRKSVSSISQLPYGDPAFLLPYLHREKLIKEASGKGLESNSRFCYIPNETDDEQLVSGKLPSGVRLVSTKLPSEQALESLQWCDFVASSSLNGIILADSLGLPTKWLQIRKGNEHAFELADYFSSTHRKFGKVKRDFDKIVDQNGYIEPLSLDERESFADRTAASFPFDLFETQQNKTLVVIMGSIRGGELAWESMYKNLLDLNSADLALVVGAVPARNRISSLYQRAKYMYQFSEFDDWADAIDLINGTGWRDDLLAYASAEDGLFGAADGRQGSGAVIFMARWYVSKMIEKYGLKERYDRFVLTRADHYYGCAHDLSLLDPAFVWVPEGQEFGGVTDRHMICNSGQIMKALDIYPNVLRHPKKYVDHVWFHRNPEQLIKRRWIEESLWDDVRHFDRVMFTCAEDGDETRWQVKSTKRAAEGVYLKYELEYRHTKCICSGKRWNATGSTCAVTKNEQ